MHVNILFPNAGQNCHLLGPYTKLALYQTDHFDLNDLSLITQGRKEDRKKIVHYFTCAKET